MTYNLGASLCIKPVRDEDLNETLWILFDNGIQHPLVVIPDYQMQRLVEAVAKHGKLPAPPATGGT